MQTDARALGSDGLHYIHAPNSKVHCETYIICHYILLITYDNMKGLEPEWSNPSNYTTLAPSHSYYADLFMQEQVHHPSTRASDAEFKLKEVRNAINMPIQHVSLPPSPPLPPSPLPLPHSTERDGAVPVQRRALEGATVSSGQEGGAQTDKHKFPATQQRL